MRIDSEPSRTVFDRLSALGDPTRSRLLMLLDGHELTVGELCAIVQLPQSTVSRHLRVLSDDGWVTSRADGTSRLYTIDVQLDAAARRLWDIVREQVNGGKTARQDAQRMRSVLAQRRSASREFFSTAAGKWDALRTEMFGARPELMALAGLFDPAWTFGDLGCGTGHLSEAVAPFVKRVIAIDASAEMLGAARRRVDGMPNVDLRQGELEALPVADGELDAAMLSLVLHHIPEPADALRDVGRTLVAGGRLLVVDMMPHARDEYRQQMGHVWQGFSEEQLQKWLAAAGLTLRQYRPLPVDPEAKGPVLFAAVVRK